MAVDRASGPKAREGRRPMKAKKRIRRLRRQAILAIVHVSIGLYRLGEGVKLPFHWASRSLCRLLPLLDDEVERGEHDG